MRFLRFVNGVDGGPDVGPAIDALEPHLVEMTYRWPGSWPVESARKRFGSADYAVGVLSGVKALLKHFYLDDQIRLVTDAGGWSAMPCAEAVAELLCEGGCPELPIAVIRGEELMPRADELADEGFEFGATRPETVSAKALIGGGPIAAALEEGARVVIASRYDTQSALRGGAVWFHGWDWDDIERVARSGAAALLPGSTVSGEVRQDSATVLPPTESVPVLPSGELIAADVGIEVSPEPMVRDPHDRWCIEGVTATGVDPSWPVEAMRWSGYESSWIPLQVDGESMLSEVLADLGHSLPAGSLSSRATEEGDLRFFRCRCDTHDQAMGYARRMGALRAEQAAEEYDFSGPLTVIHRRVVCERLWIDRDLVPIAIDTRPAAEWR